jgi:2'-5' RNA ligase
VPRVRLAVALLIPAPLSIEIDGLRRALGADMTRVAPHITLVPPVNVREEDIGDALRVLRAAAARVQRPLELALGPPATFAPVNPVVYLAVGGRDAAVLPGLRDDLLVEPLTRRIDLPFVPHVTLDDEHPPDRIDRTVDAFAQFVAPVEVTGVHVLRDRSAGPHRWNPIAEAVFAPPTVVGRGGYELEVSVSSIADPEVAALVGAATGAVVVAARPDGEVVGAIVAARRGGELVVEVTAGDADVVERLVPFALARS